MRTRHNIYPALRPLLLALFALLLSGPLGCAQTTPTNNGDIGDNGDGPSGTDIPGGDDGGSDSDTDSNGDTDTGGDLGPGDSDTGGDEGGGDECIRIKSDDGVPRRVVVSHPWREGSTSETRVWGVREVSSTGELSAELDVFELPRASLGADIVLTLDGKIGFMALEDGSLGVVRFEDSGGVTVVHHSYVGTTENAYFTHLVLHPTQDILYALNDVWRNVGGGVYALPFACDGTILGDNLIAEAKLPAGMAFMDETGETAFLAARDVLDSASDLAGHLLGVSGGVDLARQSSADIFPDEDSLIASVAVDPAGSFAFIGDNSIFLPDGTSPRIGAFLVSAGGLVAVQTLEPAGDPVAITVSPYRNALLVSDGLGNGLWKVEFNPANAAAPMGASTQLTYADGESNPSLPGRHALVKSGDAVGLVLVAENAGIRRVRFESDGSIADLGLVSTGSGDGSIVGGLAVQP